MAGPTGEDWCVGLGEELSRLEVVVLQAAPWVRSGGTEVLQGLLWAPTPNSR